MVLRNPPLETITTNMESATQVIIMGSRKDARELIGIAAMDINVIINIIITIIAILQKVKL